MSSLVGYFPVSYTHLDVYKRQTKVVLIAGNHDHLQKDSNYRSFEWNDNVYPLFGKKLEYVDFPELETAVYGLSYYAVSYTHLDVYKRQLWGCLKIMFR